MAHPNADRVRKGFDAFAAGDMATLDQLFADDVKWHVSGRSSLSGEFEGKQAVFGSFVKIREVSDTFEQDVHAVLADDEHAVALVFGHATSGGKALESQQALVFHITDGRVTEGWVTSTDPYAFDEFFPSS